MKMKLPHGFKAFAKRHAKKIKNRLEDENHPLNFWNEETGEYSSLMVHDADGDNPYLEIYDGIGWWITDQDVAVALRNFTGETLEVRINCGGGDVFMGLGIAAILSGHDAKITAKVEGICASIATVIALGCDEIEMVTGSQFMVHSASLMGYGNAEDFRIWADWLDKTTDGIVDVYEERTTIDRSEIETLMESDSYLSAQEAVEMGFADRVVKLKSANKENAEAKSNEEARLKAEADKKARVQAQAKRKRQAQALSLSGGRFQAP